MVKLGIIISLGFIVGQEIEQPTNNPCESERILKAKNEGMRSLTAKEIPNYIIDLWKCRKMPEGKNTMKRINKKTHTIDYETSERFQGFTSTCAYCSAATVIIFYIFKLI